MMTCDEARDRLSAGLDGELSPAEAADLRSHLKSCRDCERRSSLLGQTREAFRVAAMRGSFPRPVTLAAIAGMLVLAIVAARGLRPGNPPPSPKSDPASSPMAHLPAGFDGGEVNVLDTIDCGVPGATVCLVDRPCAEGFCGPQSPDLHFP